MHMWVLFRFQLALYEGPLIGNDWTGDFDTCYSELFGLQLNIKFGLQNAAKYKFYVARIGSRLNGAPLVFWGRGNYLYRRLIIALEGLDFSVHSGKWPFQQWENIGQVNFYGLWRKALDCRSIVNLAAWLLDLNLLRWTSLGGKRRGSWIPKKIRCEIVLGASCSVIFILSGVIENWFSGSEEVSTVAALRTGRLRRGTLWHY